MKPTSPLILIAIIAILTITTNTNTHAQQYKLRQSSTMMGMKTESTIYVKGPRKRTEGGAMMGIGANIVTIEQCDSQRTIRINDKKKVYLIAPFSKDMEEAEEDTKPAKTKPAPAAVTQPKEKPKVEKGGIIYNYYNITDTGERKKMYGLTARHVWTTQKMKPSPDACMMKDSMVIKTDGWYIDLPQFNCPVNYTSRQSSYNGGYQQPTCQDRFVSKRSGKGKLGFPLIETRTIFMNDGKGKVTEYETTIETLEFSMVKLDSMLFEIPLGYTRVYSEEELQDKMDMNEMIKQASSTNNYKKEKTVTSEEKSANTIRIGVYEPKGGESLPVSELQQHLVNTLTTGNIEAVAITSEDDAKKYNCDWSLSADFAKVKQGSKVGGILKAIKNTDPFATTSYNIEGNLVLTKLSGSSSPLKQKINGKYEGKIDEAAKKALDKGWNELSEELR